MAKCFRTSHVPLVMGALLILGSLAGADAETFGGIVGRHVPATTTILTDTCPCHRVLHAFGPYPASLHPAAPLLALNGLLYGTTYSGGPKHNGTVFSITPAGALTVLHEFGGSGDGQNPGYGALIDVGGSLYGTTYYGGAYGYGTIYRLSPNGAVSVIYSFGKSAAGGMILEGGLVYLGGVLYGTTVIGGASDQGTVFGVTPDGTETMLYSFGGGSDGGNPISTLIGVNGVLYGTTNTGGVRGAHSYGTVFKIVPGGAEKVIHSFGGGRDGFSPLSGLVELGGLLYGLTADGGDFGLGTVFSISPDGVKTTMHSFGSGSDDGALPGFGPLIVHNYVLYGTTMGGQRSENSPYIGGTIFSITRDSAETTLYSYGSDPVLPEAGLTDMGGNVLYGTTYRGGSAGQGTVFSIKLM